MMVKRAFAKTYLLAFLMLISSTTPYIAYAACVETISPNHLCSGSVTDTQSILVDNAIITTAAGFSVNTAVGDAIVIEANGALSFTDTHASSITSTDLEHKAINITSLADDGETNGSITVLINSVLDSDDTALFVHNRGSGATTVTTTGNITSLNGDGINATTTDDASGMTISAGSLIVGGTAVFADLRGSGTLAITTNNAIEANGKGIDAGNTDTAGDITISTLGTIASIDTGISAYLQGTGALTITANEAITSFDVRGIAAENDASGTDITITAHDLITSNDTGIYAHLSGTGSATISADAIISSNGKGVDVTNTTRGENITIITDGAITADDEAIYVYLPGTGSLSITANDSLTSENGRAISVTNANTATDITIHTYANITANGDGFSVYLGGTGATSISADASITSANGKGISVTNASTATGITITASDFISSDDTGIYSHLSGTGSLIISASSTITSNEGKGIDATSGSGSADITITSDSTISADDTGIYSYVGGSGALAITANDSITSTNNRGIDTANASTATDISITAKGAIHALSHGIASHISGTGALTILADDTITSDNDNGINASNGSTGTIIDITSNGAIQADDTAIYAYLGGTGALTITTQDSITSTNNKGIDAVNGTGGTDITVTASGGSIHTLDDAIYSYISGTGALTIFADATITSDDGAGINVANAATGTTIDITSKRAIHAHDGGISAYLGGTGALNITANDSITSDNNDGINAGNGNNATDITIIAQDISARNDGIETHINGTGAISITAHGTITSSNGKGIDASNSNDATNITIVSTGAITSDNKGIDAVLNGIGALSIKADGNITAGANNSASGIYAYNGTGTDMTVLSNGNIITSGTFSDGITVAHGNSTGDIQITSNGSITTQDIFSSGIQVSHTGTGNMTITSNGTVHAAGIFSYGINVSHTGTGNITLFINNDIASTDAQAIKIVNASENEDISLEIASDTIISGKEEALNITNNGVGTNNLTVKGTLTSETEEGIYVSANSAHITLSDGGSITGTKAINVNTGTQLDVTLDGRASDVAVEGTSGTSIDFDSGDDALTLRGIVSIDGDVDGDTGTDTLTFDGTTLTLVNDSLFTAFENYVFKGTSHITGALDISGDVTIDGSVQAASVSNSTGTIIRFGTEDDTLTIEGNVLLNGSVEAGTGTDTLAFDNTQLTLQNGSDFSGFETYDFIGSSTITGDLNLPGTDLTLGSGDNVHFNGNVTVNSLTVGDGAELGGNNHITGNVTVNNGGRLAPGNSIGVVNVIGNLVLANGSIFEVELDGSNADQTNVTGNVTINPGAVLTFLPISTFTGSTATILTTTGTITGTFGTINYNNQSVALYYSPTSKKLSLISFSSNALSAQALASLDSSILFSDTLSDQITENAFRVDDKYVWAKTFYRHSSKDSHGLLPGSEANNYGVALGNEYLVSDSYKAGFALSNITSTTKGALGVSKNETNGLFSALYGTYIKPFTSGNIFATLAVTAAYKDNDSDRKIINSGVTSYAHSSPKDKELGGILSLGTRIGILKNLAVTPKLGGAYIYTNTAAYRETNGGEAAVAIDDYDFSTLKTSQSLTFSSINKIAILDQLMIQPSIELGISQETALSHRNLSGRFINGATFNTSLDEKEKDLVYLTMGADFDITNSITGFFNYSNAFGRDEQNNDLRIGASFRF